MRTLRLSLAGTVILTLLGGLGGVILAGDENAPAADRPHQVSGTNLGYRIFESGANTREDGRTLQRGYGSYDTIEMDDARLSGTLYHVWNRDYLPYGQVLTGTVELVNDDGSWVGTMRGYKVGGHDWQMELTGTGAYEGHAALLEFRALDGYRQEVEGFVFPGTLPEYPDPVDVPAE